MIKICLTQVSIEGRQVSDISSVSVESLQWGGQTCGRSPRRTVNLIISTGCGTG